VWRLKFAINASEIKSKCLADGRIDKPNNCALFVSPAKWPTFWLSLLADSCDDKGLSSQTLFFQENLEPLEPSNAGLIEHPAAHKQFVQTWNTTQTGQLK